MATSAACEVAYGVLFLAIVLGPYRRGDGWAWKAVLIARLTQFVLVGLRIPVLGTHLGVSPAATQVGILVAGSAIAAWAVMCPISSAGCP